MKFMIRAFVANPGGVYDPLPLHDFDTDTDATNGFIPSVGDVWRFDETKPAYIVKERFFSVFSQQCSLTVEETNKRPLG